MGFVLVISRSQLGRRISDTMTTIAVFRNKRTVSGTNLSYYLVDIETGTLRQNELSYLAKEFRN